MSYEQVLIYTPTGDFLGYGVRNKSLPKLHSQNIYTETEIANVLGRLNEDVDLRRNWPDARDPEVVAILSDPTFMPLQMVEEEMVDDANSHYVWLVQPDPLTGELGSLDRDASVIAWKKIMVPAEPTAAVQRQRAAAEIVAHRRVNQWKK